MSLDDAKLEYTRCLNSQVIKDSIPLWMRLCSVTSPKASSWVEQQTHFRCIYEAVPDMEFSRHYINLKLNEHSMTLASSSEECSEYNCQLFEWHVVDKLELDEESCVLDVLRKIAPSKKTKQERRSMIVIPPEILNDPAYESDEDEDAYSFYDKVSELIKTEILTDDEWTMIIDDYGIPESCCMMLRTLWAFSRLLRDNGPSDFSRYPGSSLMTVPCLCSSGHNLEHNTWSFQCLDYEAKPR